MPTLPLRAIPLLCAGLLACANSPATDPAERGPLGAADSVGSCEATLCNGISPEGDCYCDDLCVGYGDCCADYAQVCGPDEPEPPEEPESDWAMAACTGSALSQSAAVSLFAAGEVRARLGVYRVFARERQCNTVTGCTDWQDAEIDTEELLPTGRPAGATEVFVDDQNAVRFALGDLCSMGLDGESATCGLDGVLGASYTISSGVVRETCAAFVATTSEPIDAVQTMEREVVIRADHGVVVAGGGGALDQLLAQSPTLALDCVHEQWGHEWTCQGAYRRYYDRSDSVTLSGNLGSITIETSGELLPSSHDLTLSFDGDGVAHHKVEDGYIDSASREETLVLARGDSLIYEATYYRNYGASLPGCPTSGNAYYCTGVLAVP